MAKNSKQKTTVLIILLVCVAVFGAKIYLDSKKAQMKIASSARSKGNESAPLKIVEFIDFQCPACAEGSKYLKGYMSKNPDAIFLEVKHFPLRMHRHGVLSSQYAECAARQGKFWPMHDYLIERQNDWRNLEDVKSIFDLMAQNIDLDEDILDVCLQDQSVMDSISKNKAEGETLGVQSTPTYFVNGQMAVGFKNLSAKIIELTNAQ